MVTEEKKKGLKQKIYSGLRWSAFSRFVQGFCTFAVPIILARLLYPEAFGLIVMANVFTGITAIITDLGTGASIVQKQETDLYFESSIFWFNITTAGTVWLIIVLTTPLIASIYGRPILKPIIYVQSVTILLSGLNIVPIHILQKQFKFSKLAAARIFSLFASAGVAIILAWSGYGVWSLVAHSVAERVFMTTSIWLVFTPWTPKIHFSFKHIKEIFAFSSNLTGAKFLNYFQRNTDNFIIGYLLGAQSLGLYSKAYGLLLKPIKMINGFLGPVLFPAMSALSTEEIRLRMLYLRSIQGLALIYFPIAATLILFARPIIYVLLGQQWLPMVPLVPVFALVLFYQPLDKVGPQLLKALDRTDIIFKLNLVFTPITLIGFLIGARFGVLGVAISYVLTSFLLFLVRTHYSINLIGIRLHEFASSITKVFVYTFLSSLSMFIAGKLGKTVFIDSDWLVLAVSLTVGSAIYLLLHLWKPVPSFMHMIDLLNLPFLKPKAAK
jgi:O-antigen/teichoic acid export membrane protein